jgi:hypothetical protein
MAITRTAKKPEEALVEKPKLTKEQRAKRKARRLAKDLPTVAEIEQEIEQKAVSANPQEQQHLEEYIRMFRMLRRMCRKAERQCLKSGQSRDYYAYCTLLSQQREVINDIRAIADSSQQIHILDDTVLQPFARSIGQNLLDSFYQLRRLTTETSAPDQTQFALKKQDEIVKEQGRYLQHMYQRALEQMTKALT